MTATAHQRRQAVQRVLAGESPEMVIQELGFHRSRIYAWLKAYREQGDTGLAPTDKGGRPPVLNSRNRTQLFRLLAQGSPQDYGLQGKLWSTDLVATLLEQELSVSLGKTALNRLLSTLGLQNRRLRQRLEKKHSPTINQWLKADYQTLRQQTVQENAALWLLDSHSYLYLKNHDALKSQEALKLQTLLAVSPQGDLYFRVFEGSFSFRECRDFLLELIHLNGKKIILLFDSNDPVVNRALQSRGTIQLRSKQRCINRANHPLAPIQLPVKRKPAASKKQHSGKRTPNSSQNLYLKDSFTDTPPPLDDIKSWSLILHRGLLDEQTPLSTFLANLSAALKGAAVIASDLHAPASLIRPLSDALTLTSLIRLNQHISESWNDNPFIPVLKKPGDLYCLEDIVAIKDWHHYKYCRLHLSWHSEHVIALCYAGPNNTLCGLFISRQPGEPEFSPQERAFLHALRPHLEVTTALAIRHWRDTFTVKALEDTTDHLEIAALVLDGNGRVIRTSGAAEEMLLQKQFFSQKKGQDKGQLSFPDKHNQQLFEDAVAAAIAWRQAPIGNKPVEAMRLSYPGGSWIGVLVQPITPPSFAVPHSAAVSPHVAVYITDPNKPRANPQHQLIMRLFNLSTREAYLTTLLTSGHSLAEAAAAMNITQKTARGYLQHIYEKVGVNRRQDLIQRVMKSVALLV